MNVISSTNSVINAVGFLTIQFILSATQSMQDFSWLGISLIAVWIVKCWFMSVIFIWQILIESVVLFNAKDSLCLGRTG
jgi:hypothetical protein